MQTNLSRFGYPHCFWWRGVLDFFKNDGQKLVEIAYNNLLSTTKRQSEGCQNFKLALYTGKLTWTVRYPPDCPGFVKIVHEALGMTKRAGNLQVKALGMTAES